MITNQKPKVAIVGSSSFGSDFPEHIERLQAFSDVTVFSIPQEQNEEMTAIARSESTRSLIQKLKPYHGIIASVDPVYNSELLNNLDNLLVIARHGIGYNNIDFNCALERGIVVTKVEGWVEQASVAELAVGLALAAARKIVAGHNALFHGRWEDRKFFSGPEIAGSTVGVIGCGNIGSGAVKLFKAFCDLAPGGKVLVYDPNVTESEIYSFGGIPASKIDIIRQADIISLHCLLNEKTTAILGAEEFSQMKQDTIIVNTARGALVDENSLASYLKSGKLFYAADVFESEPIPKSSCLLSASNTVLTPHIGGYGNASKRGMGDACVGALEMVLANRKVPVSVLNSKKQSVGCLIPEHLRAYQKSTVSYKLFT